VVRVRKVFGSDRLTSEKGDDQESKENNEVPVPTVTCTEVVSLNSLGNFTVVIDDENNREVSAY
jgi:hypothetical protein